VNDRPVVSGALRLRILLLIAFPALAFAVWHVFPHQKPCQSACVAFLGDSIISNWLLLQPPNQFSGLQIANRGFPGDTTAHMLARFRHDVIQLRPRVVVILGGINDFAQMPLSITEQNFTAMSQTAQENKIRVVLATLPPAHQANSDSSSVPASGQDQLLALNSWLKSFAAQNHFPVADFYSALADDRGLYQSGLTYDGIHPTAAGYQRMEPLLRAAIQIALLSPN
jgi:lysophospholipase L1-like esterase